MRWKVIFSMTLPNPSARVSKLTILNAKNAPKPSAPGKPYSMAFVIRNPGGNASGLAYDFLRVVSVEDVGTHLNPKAACRSRA